MKASDYNKQFARERVDHIGQPPCSLPPEEIWRAVGPLNKERVSQISNKGRWRSVSTKALLYGGDLKPHILPIDGDLHTRDLVFPTEREVLW